MSKDYHILKLPIKLLWKSHNLIDLIHTIVGLGTLNLQPITSEIELIFPSTSQSGKLEFTRDEDGYRGLRKLDFFRLFRSYPPFEPLSVESIYRDAIIKGDYVWFIRSKNIQNYQSLVDNFVGFSDICRNILNEDIKCEEIICGIYKVIGDRIRIDKLLIPRCISDGKSPWYKELNLKIDNMNVKLIYGYYHLVNKHRKLLDTILKEKGFTKDKGIPRPYEILDKQVIEKLQQVLINSKKSGYDVASLDYASWCYKGLEVCTDPFSSNEICTFCVNKQTNIICQKKVPGFGIYHYSRRIFPKVYAEIDNEVSPSLLKNLALRYTIPLSVFLIHGAIIESIVKSFTLYPPGTTSLCITIEPDKKPATPARVTNGLLIMIHEDIVNAFIDALTTSRCECNVGINRPPLSLLDLLITKYLFSEIGCSNQYKLEFKMDPAKSLINILLNKETITDYVTANKSEIIKKPEFLRFVGLSIVHTLAHLLMLSISSQFNLDLDDLLYVYGETPIYSNAKQFQGIKFVYYAGVFENNDYGSIQLDEEIKRSLLSVDKEVISVPRTYQVNLKGFTQFISKAVSDIVSRYDEEILPSVKDAENDINIFIKKAPTVIYESINRDNKCWEKVDQGIVKDVIDVFIDLLIKSANYWRSKGLVLDQNTISIVIQQAVYELDKDIKSYVAKVIGSRYKDLSKKCTEKIVEEVLDKFWDKYLNEVISMIEPNYCLDGCNADIHLEKYCLQAIKENYLTSRCLLTYFLSFIGINYGSQPVEFKVGGEVLERIINAANNKVRIQTSYISTQGIHALANILARNVRTELILDIRLKKEKPIYVKDLEELKSRFKDTFSYEFTHFPEHGKRIVVDNLIIHTSWNYGTGEKVLQNYIAFIKD